MSDTPLFELNGVVKEYVGPSERIRVLKGISLKIGQGDSMAILGASGSGKTTLLHLLGSLDIASRGSVLFLGKDLSEISPRERAKLRNLEIGFVFQFHHLLPEFTTFENVSMPARIAGLDQKKTRELTLEALEIVGLTKRKKHKVTTLSGGERQRAAIARAILLRPKALLADEPTGNLDEGTGQRISEALVRLNEDLKMTLVLVTHNRKMASRMNRKFDLESGELHEIA
ncbi:MAG: ABC transporter ATP-binding protein [Desulfovibrionales bacterium]